MKTDVSIHFTIKGQDVKYLNLKLNRWFEDNQKQLKFDFSERTEPRSILHHCFLPKKTVEERGWSTDIYDELLDTLSEQKVCWFGTSDYGLVWDRKLMLENLAKLNGVCLFLGEIKEGVKEEYDLAKELGIEIIEIK